MVDIDIFLRDNYPFEQFTIIAHCPVQKINHWERQLTVYLFLKILITLVFPRYLYIKNLCSDDVTAVS